MINKEVRTLLECAVNLRDFLDSYYKENCQTLDPTKTGLVAFHWGISVSLEGFLLVMQYNPMSSEEMHKFLEIATIQIEMVTNFIQKLGGPGDLIVEEVAEA